MTTDEIYQFYSVVHFVGEWDPAIAEIGRVVAPDLILALGINIGATLPRQEMERWLRAPVLELLGDVRIVEGDTLNVEPGTLVISPRARAGVQEIHGLMLERFTPQSIATASCAIIHAWGAYFGRAHACGSVVH